MQGNDLKRLSRLTAILTQLQTKRVLTAAMLAAKFSVSIRTIYRDINALQQSGVPVYAEDGIGYSLMKGYKIPLVMFTENEANALITAEQIVLKNRDSSLIKEYTEAISKIKAVLLYTTKEKADLLSKRISGKIIGGTFPSLISDKRTIPTYTVDQSHGLGLLNGGYYFYFNDHEAR